MKSLQYSYFFIRGYFKDAEHVLKGLSAAQFRHYAFILHDKDVFHADEKHYEGLPKEPHYHIALNTLSKQTWKWVKKKIEDACGEGLGLHVEDMHDAKGAIEYLTHSSAAALQQQKHIYPVSDIHSDNILYWGAASTAEECAKEKVDYICRFKDEVIEKGWCPRQLLVEYAKDGGTNFIYNYRRALQFAADVLGCTIEDVWYKPENRSIDAKEVIDNVYKKG